MKFELIRKKFIRGKLGHVTGAEYFYFDTDPRSRQDLAIVCGGWEKCGPDFEVNRNSYPYHVIKYTLSGRGVFTVAGREFELAPNWISGFGPHDPHAYKADPHDPMEHLFVIFTGSKAGELMKQSTLRTRHAFKVAQPVETTYLLKSLFTTACRKPPYAQQLCCAYLVSLLLTQAQERPAQMQQSNAFQKYLACRNYIDKNFLHSVTIDSIAQACDINIRYMARLFRSFAAMTPHQYLMRLRLNKAAEMLLNTSMTVVDIAFVSGFQDQYHFSKSFKKFHNLAPKNFRLLHMNTR